MAASAVTPRAALQGSAEQTAQRLCMNIALNQSQAVSTKNNAQLAKVIKDQAEYVSKISPTTPWTKLAIDLYGEASAFVKKGTLPKVSPLPASFNNDPAKIEVALRSAYQFTLLNQKSAEVRKCLDAAQKAIAALPITQGQAKCLTARLTLTNGLIAQKNITAAAPAPKQAPQGCLTKAVHIAKRVWAHPATKIALLAITVLGIYSLATSGVNSLVVNDQAAKALADAISKAEGFTNTAVKAANDAASATTVEAAREAYVTAREASWSVVSIAKNFPAVQPSAYTAAEALKKTIEFLHILEADYMAERRFGSFAEWGLNGLFGMSMFMFLTGMPLLAVAFFSPESSYPKITHEHFQKAAKIAKAACVHSVTKKALLAIAALSLFHATGLVPSSLKWTKFATVQASFNTFRSLSYVERNFYCLWAALIPPYLYMLAVWSNTVADIAGCCSKRKPARELG